jgi:5-formyltetrahydrofolate cyclo-ligase
MTDPGRRRAADDPGAPDRRGKRAARERALAARDALAPAARTAFSARICARAAALPELARARTVMLFASFRSEVDTGPLIDECRARGIVLALPRVAGPRLLEAVLVSDPAVDLTPGTWGIPEPRAGCALADPRSIDVVFLPGAAFSPAGARCGYGGGFYDTFLPRLVAETPRVALAFEAQVLDNVPCEAHDLTVDAIVTEERVIRCGAVTGRG